MSLTKEMNSQYASSYWYLRTKDFKKDVKVNKLIIQVDSQLSLARPFFDQTRKILVLAERIIGVNSAIC